MTIFREGPEASPEGMVTTAAASVPWGTGPDAAPEAAGAEGNPAAAKAEPLAAADGDDPAWDSGCAACQRDLQRFAGLMRTMLADADERRRNENPPCPHCDRPREGYLYKITQMMEEAAGLSSKCRPTSPSEDSPQPPPTPPPASYATPYASSHPPQFSSSIHHPLHPPPSTPPHGSFFKQSSPFSYPPTPPNTPPLDSFGYPLPTSKPHSPISSPPRTPTTALYKAPQEYKQYEPESEELESVVKYEEPRPYSAQGWEYSTSDEGWPPPETPPSAPPSAETQPFIKTYSKTPTSVQTYSVKVTQSKAEKTRCGKCRMKTSSDSPRESSHSNSPRGSETPQWQPRTSNDATSRSRSRRIAPQGQPSSNTAPLRSHHACSVHISPSTQLHEELVSDSNYTTTGQPTVLESESARRGVRRLFVEDASARPQMVSNPRPRSPCVTPVTHATCTTNEETVGFGRRSSGTRSPSVHSATYAESPDSSLQPVDVAETVVKSMKELLTSLGEQTCQALDAVDRVHRLVVRSKSPTTSVHTSTRTLCWDTLAKPAGVEDDEAYALPEQDEADSPYNAVSQQMRSHYGSAVVERDFSPEVFVLDSGNGNTLVSSPMMLWTQQFKTPDSVPQPTKEENILLMSNLRHIDCIIPKDTSKATSNSRPSIPGSWFCPQHSGILPSARFPRESPYYREKCPSLEESPDKCSQFVDSLTVMNAKVNVTSSVDPPAHQVTQKEKHTGSEVGQDTQHARPENGEPRDKEEPTAERTTGTFENVNQARCSQGEHLKSSSGHDVVLMPPNGNIDLAKKQRSLDKTSKLRVCGLNVKCPNRSDVSEPQDTTASDFDSNIPEKDYPLSSSKSPPCHVIFKACETRSLSQKQSTAIKSLSSCNIERSALSLETTPFRPVFAPCSDGKTPPEGQCANALYSTCFPSQLPLQSPSHFPSHSPQADSPPTRQIDAAESSQYSRQIGEVLPSDPRVTSPYCPVHGTVTRQDKYNAPVATNSQMQESRVTPTYCPAHGTVAQQANCNAPVAANSQMQDSRVNPAYCPAHGTVVQQANRNAPVAANSQMQDSSVTPAYCPAYETFAQQANCNAPVAANSQMQGPTYFTPCGSYETSCTRDVNMATPNIHQKQMNVTARTSSVDPRYDLPSSSCEVPAQIAVQCATNTYCNPPYSFEVIPISPTTVATTTTPVAFAQRTGVDVPINLDFIDYRTFGTPQSQPPVQFVAYTPTQRPQPPMASHYPQAAHMMFPHGCSPTNQGTTWERLAREAQAIASALSSLIPQSSEEIQQQLEWERIRSDALEVAKAVLQEAEASAPTAPETMTEQSWEQIRADALEVARAVLREAEVSTSTATSSDNTAHQFDERAWEKIRQDAEEVARAARSLGDQNPFYPASVSPGPTSSMATYQQARSISTSSRTLPSRIPRYVPSPDGARGAQYTQTSTSELTAPPPPSPPPAAPDSGIPRKIVFYKEPPSQAQPLQQLSSRGKSESQRSSHQSAHHNSHASSTSASRSNQPGHSVLCRPSSPPQAKDVMSSGYLSTPDHSSTALTYTAVSCTSASEESLRMEQMVASAPPSMIYSEGRDVVEAKAGFGADNVGDFAQDSREKRGPCVGRCLKFKDQTEAPNETVISWTSTWHESSSDGPPDVDLTMDLEDSRAETENVAPANALDESKHVPHLETCGEVTCPAIQSQIPSHPESTDVKAEESAPQTAAKKDRKPEGDTHMEQSAVGTVQDAHQPVICGGETFETGTCYSKDEEYDEGSTKTQATDPEPQMNDKESLDPVDNQPLKQVSPIEDQQALPSDNDGEMLYEACHCHSLNDNEYKNEPERMVSTSQPSPQVESEIEVILNKDSDEPPLSPDTQSRLTALEVAGRQLAGVSESMQYEQGALEEFQFPVTEKTSTPKASLSEEDYEEHRDNRREVRTMRLECFRPEYCTEGSPQQNIYRSFQLQSVIQANDSFTADDSDLNENGSDEKKSRRNFTIQYVFATEPTNTPFFHRHLEQHSVNAENFNCIVNALPVNFPGIDKLPEVLLPSLLLPANQSQDRRHEWQAQQATQTEWVRSPWSASSSTKRSRPISPSLTYSLTTSFSPSLTNSGSEESLSFSSSPQHLSVYSSTPSETSCNDRCVTASPPVTSQSTVEDHGERIARKAKSSDSVSAEATTWKQLPLRLHGARNAVLEAMPGARAGLDSSAGELPHCFSIPKSSSDLDTESSANTATREIIARTRYLLPHFSLLSSQYSRENTQDASRGTRGVKHTMELREKLKNCKCPFIKGHNFDNVCSNMLRNLKAHLTLITSTADFAQMLVDCLGEAVNVQPAKFNERPPSEQRRQRVSRSNLKAKNRLHSGPCTIDRLEKDILAAMQSVANSLTLKEEKDKQTTRFSAVSDSTLEYPISLLSSYTACRAEAGSDESAEESSDTAHAASIAGKRAPRAFSSSSASSLGARGWNDARRWERLARRRRIRCERLGTASALAPAPLVSEEKATTELADSGEVVAMETVVDGGSLGNCDGSGGGGESSNKETPSPEETPVSLNNAQTVENASPEVTNPTQISPGCGNPEVGSEASSTHLSSSVSQSSLTTDNTKVSHLESMESFRQRVAAVRSRDLSRSRATFANVLNTDFAFDSTTDVSGSIDDPFTQDDLGFLLNLQLNSNLRRRTDSNISLMDFEDTIVGMYCNADEQTLDEENVGEKTADRGKIENAPIPQGVASAVASKPPISGLDVSTKSLSHSLRGSRGLYLRATRSSSSESGSSRNRNNTSSPTTERDDTSPDRSQHRKKKKDLRQTTVFTRRVQSLPRGSPDNKFLGGEKSEFEGMTSSSDSPLVISSFFGNQMDGEGLKVTEKQSKGDKVPQETKSPSLTSMKSKINVFKSGLTDVPIEQSSTVRELDVSEMKVSTGSSSPVLQNSVNHCHAKFLDSTSNKSSYSPALAVLALTPPSSQSQKTRERDESAPLTRRTSEELEIDSLAPNKLSDSSSLVIRGKAVCLPRDMNPGIPRQNFPDTSVSYDINQTIGSSRGKSPSKEASSWREDVPDTSFISVRKYGGRTQKAPSSFHASMNDTSSTLCQTSYRSRNRSASTESPVPLQEKISDRSSGSTLTARKSRSQNSPVSTRNKIPDGNSLLTDTNCERRESLESSSPNRKEVSASKFGKTCINQTKIPSNPSKLKLFEIRSITPGISHDKSPVCQLVTSPKVSNNNLETTCISESQTPPRDRSSSPNEKPKLKPNPINKTCNNILSLNQVSSPKVSDTKFEQRRSIVRDRSYSPQKRPGINYGPCKAQNKGVLQDRPWCSQGNASVTKSATTCNASTVSPSRCPLASPKISNVGMKVTCDVQTLTRGRTSSQPAKTSPTKSATSCKSSTHRTDLNLPSSSQSPLKSTNVSNAKLVMTGKGLGPVSNCSASPLRKTSEAKSAITSKFHSMSPSQSLHKETTSKIRLSRDLSSSLKENIADSKSRTPCKSRSKSPPLSHPWSPQNVVSEKKFGTILNAPGKHPQQNHASSPQKVETDNAIGVVCKRRGNSSTQDSLITDENKTSDSKIKTTPKTEGKNPSQGRPISPQSRALDPKITTMRKTRCPSRNGHSSPQKKESDPSYVSKRSSETPRGVSIQKNSIANGKETKSGDKYQSKDVSREAENDTTSQKKTPRKSSASREVNSAQQPRNLQKMMEQNRDIQRHSIGELNASNAEATSAERSAKSVCSMKKLPSTKRSLKSLGSEDGMMAPKGDFQGSEEATQPLSSINSKKKMESECVRKFGKTTGIVGSHEDSQERSYQLFRMMDDSVEESRRESRIRTLKRARDIAAKRAFLIRQQRNLQKNYALAETSLYNQQGKTSSIQNLSLLAKSPSNRNTRSNISMSSDISVGSSGSGYRPQFRKSALKEPPGDVTKKALNPKPHFNERMRAKSSPVDSRTDTRCLEKSEIVDSKMEATPPQISLSIPVTETNIVSTGHQIDAVLSSTSCTTIPNLIRNSNTRFQSSFKYILSKNEDAEHYTSSNESTRDPNDEDVDADISPITNVPEDKVSTVQTAISSELIYVSRDSIDVFDSLKSPDYSEKKNMEDNIDSKTNISTTSKHTVLPTPNIVSKNCLQVKNSSGSVAEQNTQDSQNRSPNVASSSTSDDASSKASSLTKNEDTLAPVVSIPSFTASTKNANPFLKTESFEMETSEKSVGNSLGYIDSMSSQCSPSSRESDYTLLPSSNEEISHTKHSDPAKIVLIERIKTPICTSSISNVSIPPSHPVDDENRKPMKGKPLKPPVGSKFRESSADSGRGSRSLSPRQRRPPPLENESSTSTRSGYHVRLTTWPNVSGFMSTLTKQTAVKMVSPVLDSWRRVLKSRKVITQKQRSTSLNYRVVKPSKASSKGKPLPSKKMDSKSPSAGPSSQHSTKSSHESTDGSTTPTTSVKPDRVLSPDKVTSQRKSSANESPSSSRNRCSQKVGNPILQKLSSERSSGSVLGLKKSFQASIGALAQSSETQGANSSSTLPTTTGRPLGRTHSSRCDNRSCAWKTQGRADSCKRYCSLWHSQRSQPTSPHLVSNLNDYMTVLNETTSVHSFYRSSSAPPSRSYNRCPRLITRLSRAPLDDEGGLVSSRSTFDASRSSSPAGSIYFDAMDAVDETSTPSLSS